MSLGGNSRDLMKPLGACFDFFRLCFIAEVYCLVIAHSKCKNRWSSIHPNFCQRCIASNKLGARNVFVLSLCQYQENILGHRLTMREKLASQIRSSPFLAPVSHRSSESIPMLLVKQVTCAHSIVMPLAKRLVALV